MFKVNGEKIISTPVKKRVWCKYSKDLLNFELSKVDWNIGVDDVQEFWCIFENKLIKVVDTIVPMVDHYKQLIQTSCSFLAIRLCFDKQNTSLHHRTKGPKRG